MITKTPCGASRRFADEIDPVLFGKELRATKRNRSHQKVPSSEFEAQEVSRSCWETEEGDLHAGSRSRSSIACQSLSPGETPMSTLCTGKVVSRRGLSRWRHVSQLDVNALMTKKLHPLPPMKASLPVSPQDRMSSEQWRRWRGRGGCFACWPEHGTDAAWFLGGSTIALALLPQQTRTTMTDAGGVENAQAATTFGSPFLGIEGGASRTAKGAIWLGSEL